MQEKVFRDSRLLTVDNYGYVRNLKAKVLEREIDRLVYELYGLTEEEIKIVEGKQNHVR